MLKNIIALCFIAALSVIWADAKVQEIQSEQEFHAAVQKSDEILLVIDFYADWCGPCRRLSPILSALSETNQEKAYFIKVNADKFPSLCRTYGVEGIPHVTFVNDKKTVSALTGLYMPEDYEQVINKYQKTKKKDSVYKPSGSLDEGIRIIKIPAGLSALELYVFRGETVKLIMEPRNYDFTVNIPEYKVAAKSKKNQPLEIVFKAAKTGVYPVFCNGNCPSGNGSQVGQITVMQYAAEEKAEFKEISASVARDMLMKKNILLLDVRTPAEYYQGHIAGSVHIPLNQLEARISEIGDYKNKQVLIYCHSGNRSVVASQILIDKGFKKIAHIKNGISEWEEGGYPIER